MLGIAVIGLGRWGPRVAHKLLAHPAVSTVVGCEVNADRRRAAQRSAPSMLVTEHPKAVLSDPRIDAVVVATPIPTHENMGLATLRSGKHLWLEKPMATSVAGAEALVAEAERTRRVLLVGHTPQYAAAADAIDRLGGLGAVGEPAVVTATRLSSAPIGSADGFDALPITALWDLAVHDVALTLRWLANRASGRRVPTRIAIPYRGQRRMEVEVAFEDIIVRLAAGYDAVRRRTFSITGPAGMLSWTDGRTGDRVERTSKQGAVERISLAPGDALSSQIDDFIQCVRFGRTPRSDGMHGLAVTRIWLGSKRPSETSTDDVTASGAEHTAVGRQRQRTKKKGLGSSSSEALIV